MLLITTDFFHSFLSLTFLGVIRKIYDPRRWHKRTNSGSDVGGQPPAGWVLIWAGRFKRWRRRWFVANPPGLLLHYKNSDQIGRHGCINLLVRVSLSSSIYWTISEIYYV